MKDQVTLRPGDYVSTKGLTEDDYHAVARAFMAAGAESGEYPCKEEMKGLPYFGMGCYGTRDGKLCHAGTTGRGFWLNGRHLTPQQVVSATNANRRGCEDKTMTPCEKLGYKAGDRFKVIESRHPSRNGSIVTLRQDDGSHAPYFTSEDGDQWVFRVDSDTNDRIEKIDEGKGILTTILEQASEHDATAKHHAKMHERLMQQAREMLPEGWRLVRAEDVPGGPSMTVVGGEDMADPANWREGDVVVATLKGIDITDGKMYTLCLDDGDIGFRDDAGDFRRAFHRVKWHHHP